MYISVFGCGGLVNTSSGGRISSPGFGAVSSYPANMTCVWMLDVAGVVRFTLHVYLGMQTCTDRLDVYQDTTFTARYIHPTITYLKSLKVDTTYLDSSSALGVMHSIANLQCKLTPLSPPKSASKNITSLNRLHIHVFGNHILSDQCVVQFCLNLVKL